MSVKLMNPFNPMAVDPSQGTSSLPLGRHKVVIESGSVEPTKNNDGGFLQFNLRIEEGDFKGVTGVDRLNLYNNSVKAVEIAQKRLSAYCHVTGQFQLGADGCDVSVLFNIPFYIEVTPQKLTKEQEDAKARGETVTPYTEIKKLFDINGNEPGKSGGQNQHQQQQPQQPQQQQQAANGWGNGQQNQQPQQQQQQNNQQSGWGNNQQAQQQPAQQQPAQQQQSGWGNQQQQQAQQQPQQQNGGWQQNQQPQQQQQAPWGAKS